MVARRSFRRGRNCAFDLLRCAALLPYKMSRRRLQLAIAMVLLGMFLIVVLLFHVLPFSPYWHVPTHAWKWGVVVDMGSSGSRLKIFQWADGPYYAPIQPAGLFWRFYYDRDERPGVSSFSEPKKAAKSIGRLLEYAEKKLLHNKVDLSTVPVFLYGTGGLRMLSAEDQKQTINSLRHVMTDFFPNFQFHKTWARAIPVRTEAIFDWIALQQTLKVQRDYKEPFYAFREVTNGLGGEHKVAPYNPLTDTIGIIDIGGASVEIAFEVDPELRYPSDAPSELAMPEDGSGISSVMFDGVQHRVYARGYDRMGHHTFLDHHFEALGSHGGIMMAKEYRIYDPCLLEGYYIEAKFALQNIPLPVRLYGYGNSTECAMLIQGQMRRSMGQGCNSTEAHCSIYQTVQPKVEKQLFVGLNQFRRAAKVLKIGRQPHLWELREASLRCIDTPIGAERDRMKGRKSLGELNTRCLEGLYLYFLLTEAFGFSPHSNQILFDDAFFFYQTSVTWSLGAMVHHANELALAGEQSQTVLPETM